MRGREKAGAPGSGREIQEKVGARPVRGTRKRLLTDTGMLEEARTWLQEE